MNVDQLVAELRAARLDIEGGRPAALATRELPSRDALIGIVDDLRAALFPAHFGAGLLGPGGVDAFVRATLEATLPALAAQIAHALHYQAPVAGPGDARAQDRAPQVTAAFAAALPDVRRRLGGDVRAAYEGDPAATTIDEAVFCYPGVSAIISHRIAHALHALGVPLIPRIIAEIAHGTTGIDIHPAAVIGDRFFIDHGTGVVIGETTSIGDRVRLYQGVTLGARSFPVDEQGVPRKGAPRHPVIEDDVVIYAGATILGRVRIGRGSTIGGNVWLTRSVPAGSRITQAQARSDSFEHGSGI
jgi:serine O-acetyltransferase